MLQVLKVIGYLLMIESAFMLVPAGVSFAYSGMSFDNWSGDTELQCSIHFVISAAITFACGWLMCHFCRPKNHHMKYREGFLLTATVWLFFSLFSMIPFLLTGVLDNVTDAFFEAMSGFTTTGATTITDLDHTPYGILMWRALSQWIGGMGIILFTLAVVPMLNSKGGIALFNAEVTGITHERFRPRVNRTAGWMWGLYMSLTALVFCLLLVDMPSFDAACHTLSAVSTGGFTINSGGLEGYHSFYSEVVILFTMFFCGINFSFFLTVIKDNWHSMRYHRKFNFKTLASNNTFRWYVGIIVVVTVLIANRMYHTHGSDPGYSEWKMVFDGLFDTVSAITSTGFSSYDYELDYGPYIMTVMLVAMCFGAMAGSTAGGAKIDRLIVVIKNVKNEFYKVLHPNAVNVIRVDGRPLSHDIVAKVVAFLSIYVMIMVAVALVISYQVGQAGSDTPVLDCLFTSMSAISNVGYGHGITGELHNYTWHFLPDLSKWLLSFEMMVGRLELFTVIVLFTKGFWVKD